MTTYRNLDILICDDHPMIIDAFELRLQKAPQFTNTHLNIRRAANGGEMLNQLQVKQPDCAVVDLSLPDMGGIELIKEVKEQFPLLRVLIVTGSTNTAQLDEVRHLRVSGILHKSNSGEKIASIVADLISQVKNHFYLDPYIDLLLGASIGQPLSVREYEVLRYVASGKKATEIAKIMEVGITSVRTYIERISMKTGAIGPSEMTSIYINGNFKRDLSSNVNS
ncbi:Transcriptional regulatory protein RcsB [compost metagenome]